MTDKLLYKVEEAAEILGIGRTKLFELLARKELRSVSIGSSRRITMDALVEYVARLQRPDHQGQRAS